MKHAAIIFILSVAATLVAILAGSFFFPATYMTRADLEIDAPPATVFALLCDARSHQEWNPWFGGALPTGGEALGDQPLPLPASTFQIEEASSTHLSASVALEHSVGTVTLDIESCISPTSVVARVNDNPRDPGVHTWSLERIGTGTLVEWEATGTRRRTLFGRFANTFISRLVEEQTILGLEALNDAAARAFVEDR